MSIIDASIPLPVVLALFLIAVFAVALAIPVYCREKRKRKYLVRSNMHPAVDTWEIKPPDPNDPWETLLRARGEK